MSTVWFIIWTIGIVDIFIGAFFCGKLDRKSVLMGWMLMSIGMLFNGVACLVDIDSVFNIVVGVISFFMSYNDYRVFKKKQKEFDIKEIGIKEMFFRDLKEYKIKLDRKNYKIV